MKSQKPVRQNEMAADHRSDNKENVQSNQLNDQ